jgi:FkbM family methyltransferase
MDEYLTQPIGAYKSSALQGLVVGAARHCGPFHKMLRNSASRLVQRLRAGPVDHDLFGLQVRFFPAENPGDRRALFTPDHFDKEERHLILAAFGANIGVYSLFAGAKRPDVRTLAFEPSPWVFQKLSFNVKSNGLEKCVHPKQIALSDSEGSMPFNSKSESLVLGDADISVKTDTLLNVLNQEGITRVDAVKIDVEGAEDKVLFPFFETAPKSLWPSLVVIEHVFPGQWSRNCLQLLESSGYEKQWTGKLNTAYRLKR